MPRHPRGIHSLRSNDLAPSAAQQTVADGAEIVRQAHRMTSRQATMLRLPYVAPAAMPWR